MDDVTDFIESNNNDAQLNFEGLLEKLDPEETTDLTFETPLSGDLNFSVLKDRQFHNIETISFQQPGNVTRLLNIPERVNYIECDNQKLTALDDLPSSLEELYVSNNNIPKFSGKECPKLRILHINNNELTVLEDLPETLEILECENNMLRKLNLEKTQKLKTLKVSNNPLLLLEHVPPTLEHIEMENNPFTEIEREDGKKYDKKKQEKKVEFLDALYEYFKLKNEYEKKVKKLKKTAFEKGNSKKEGRKLAQQVKVECAHCKKKVGMEFFTKDNTYYAVCGDRKNPCSLHIEIYRGDYYNLDEVMAMEREEMEESREKLVKLKMDSLFGYLSDHHTNIKFKKQMETYNEDAELNKTTMEKYNSLYNNIQRIHETKEKQKEVYAIMQEIEKLNNDYKEGDNREVLTASVSMQIKDLIPALNNLRWMKYDTMLVEDDTTTGMSHLVQREVSIQHKDYIIGKEPEVVRFEMGDKKPRPKRDSCNADEVDLPDTLTERNVSKYCKANGKPLNKMALQLHPDKNPNCKEEAEVKFKKITELCEK